MTNTPCSSSPVPRRPVVHRLSVLRRLLLCTAIALCISLPGCGARHDRQGTAVGQQAKRPATDRTGQPPVGGYRAASIAGDYAGYASLELFIEEMVQKHGFEREYLRGLFSEAERKNWTLDYLAKSDRAMKGKPAAGGYTRYRAKFVDELHIDKGLKFADSHRAALQRASRLYGVPEEYILAILAVETIFGGNVGNHRVLDALTTLSFDYARRGEYFRSELENFLLMARDEGLDPAEPVGSFAGAMGLGQFMPSSFLRYAVDFNGDGLRNLWDPEDAIGSIANYFAQHGWRHGKPVVSPLTARKTITVEPGIKKPYTLAEIEAAGFHPVRPHDTDGPFHLLLLRYRDRDQYLIGYQNFYTITRYNNSVYYAMAVHDLAQAMGHRTDIVEK